MKKIYTTVIIVLAALSAFAQQQLPNSDFERWGAYTCTGFDTLAGYLTSDEAYYNKFPFCPTTPGVSKSTDAHSGSYAISLKPTNYFGNNVSTYVSFSDFSAAGPAKGIPFTGRPSKITGYYKFNSGSAADSLTVSFTFTKDGDAFGGTFFRTGKTAGSYTKFELPVYYADEQSPDSLTMFIQIGDEKGVAHTNTSALLDHFVFEYPSTGLDPDAALRNGVTVIQKEGSIEFSEKVSNVKISDIIGNTVFETTSELLQIHTNSLSRGVYILTYYYNNKPVSEKIVIN